MKYDKDKNPVTIEYGDMTVKGFIINETRQHIIFAAVEGSHESVKVLNKDFIIEISPIFATPQNKTESDVDDIMFN